MTNEAFSLGLPTWVDLDLAYQLRKSGDMRTPNEIVGLAIRSWLATNCGVRSGRGYQWKQLFVPDGTDLRMRYRGASYYARVEGDPRMGVDGHWHCPQPEVWTRAAMWRSQSGTSRIDPHTDRRVHSRRSTD